VTTRKCQNCQVQENQTWTNLGPEREFAPIERVIERVKDTADLITLRKSRSSAQSLLEFYAQERGRGIRPAKHAVRVDRKEIELPPLTDRATSESDEQ